MQGRARTKEREHTPSHHHQEHGHDSTLNYPKMHPDLRIAAAVPAAAAAVAAAAEPASEASS